MFLPGESSCNEGEVSSIPGEGNGNPLQYSCLENPGTEEPGGLCLWGHTESDTTEVTATAAAAAASILARKIPWTQEPGRLQFMGSQKESDMT